MYMEIYSTAAPARACRGARGRRRARTPSIARAVQKHATARRTTDNLRQPTPLAASAAGIYNERAADRGLREVAAVHNIAHSFGSAGAT
jgi:hypothetical protein